MLKCGNSGTGQTKFGDLSPLTGMSLTTLYLHGTNVSELSPLRGMSLTTMGSELVRKGNDGSCAASGDAPVTPELHRNEISDLTPLAGMPLTFFHCGATKVSDLSPLEGMKLTDVNCSGSLVSDLSPLLGMPLTSLHCIDTRVSDLSPLQGMKLNEVAFTLQNIKKGLDFIRQMKSLKVIRFAFAENCTLSADEFWKRYDAGEFGKPAASNKPWEPPPPSSSGSRPLKLCPPRSRSKRSARS